MSKPVKFFWMLEASDNRKEWFSFDWASGTSRRQALRYRERLLLDGWRYVKPVKFVRAES